MQDLAINVPSFIMKALSRYKGKELSDGEILLLHKKDKHSPGEVLANDLTLAGAKEATGARCVQIIKKYCDCLDPLNFKASREEYGTLYVRKVGHFTMDMFSCPAVHEPVA